METNNKTSREERFDKQFVAKNGWEVEEKSAKIIKFFIKEEMNLLLDELLSEVGEEEKLKEYPGWQKSEFEVGYNQALEDVRAIINHKKQI
jgi:hypothetical protein